MAIILKTEQIVLKTKGYTDIINITPGVQKFVDDNGLVEGQLLIFINGSTAAISTVEYEPGLLKDIPDALDKIAPMNTRYHHDDTWHDGNGYAHVRSTLMGSSFTVPVFEGRLVLGTWQQIILLDFDNSPRNRNVTLQFIGEK
ncbi:MAG: secondary thiamine-phosphate synthase enzyme YjbQ [Calditrichaceae bacterium]|jgi:secondary thiamine-phosphate synthase enzyme